MNEPLNREGGRSVIKIALETFPEIDIGELAEKLNWSFQRTRSQLKTQAKKLNKELVKAKHGIYITKGTTDGGTT
jgi:hypothetical protein